MPDEDFRLADHARSQAHDSRLKTAGMTCRNPRAVTKCGLRNSARAAAGNPTGTGQSPVPPSGTGLCPVHRRILLLPIFAPRDDPQLA